MARKAVKKEGRKKAGQKGSGGHAMGTLEDIITISTVPLIAVEATAGI